MKINIAYNTQGQIVAAGEVGEAHATDKPQERPGVHVAELEVPEEHKGKKLHEFLHELRVDTQARKLVAKV